MRSHSQKGRLSIRGATVAILDGLIAIVLLVGGATWERYSAAGTAQQWLRHSRAVLTAAEDLSYAVHNAETGQRGYLLTGDDNYLLPYTVSIDRIGPLQGELQRLTADDPAEQDHLRALAPVLERKLAEMARTVRLRREDGFEAALGVVRTNSGHDEMMQIEASLAAVRLVEQVRHDKRLAQFDRRGVWLSGLALAGAVLVLVTLLIAVRMLYNYATIDAMTGLLSRNRMWELFAAANASRNRRIVAMMFVDIDRFRSVNQVFGREAGNALFAQIGRRLSAIAGRYHVGRVGGDDFVVFCVGIAIAEAEQLGRAIVASLAEPFEVAGKSLNLTASVGVAHTDSAGDVDLRQGADDAMYVAKYRGGNQAVAFLTSMHDLRKDAAELEQALHLALEREDELSMAYQPVVRTADRTLAAVEALARWTHPRLGSIPPDRFIELAESRGMIIPLGLKLMGIAVRQAAAWRSRFPGKCPTIHVNISPLQFAGSDVIADFLDLLEQHDLPPSDFCIEVTESAFTNADAVRAMRDALRLGFKVTMDDFGIGYSALSQLPRLPLVSIKLDRSFISQAADSPDDAAMLTAIVQLAHALKLKVIAEGVERADQFDLVAEFGCDGVQEFFFSRPMAPGQFDAWLSGETPLSVEPQTV
jgi:diguanylate cyclase (GGDEF)-like protein